MELGGNAPFGDHQLPGAAQRLAALPGRGRGPGGERRHSGVNRGGGVSSGAVGERRDGLGSGGVHDGEGVGGGQPRGHGVTRFPVCWISAPAAAKIWSSTSSASISSSSEIANGGRKRSTLP